MTQHFKGDSLEVKLAGTFDAVINPLLQELTRWYNDAYESYDLGKIIFDEDKIPLTNAIPRDAFYKNYGTILERWQYVGSFESYLTVFKMIFGPDSVILFERPAPGCLNMSISTQRTSVFKWVTSRYAKRAARIVDHAGAQLVLRQLLGINDFFEVQAVLNSLNPAGIYLTVNFEIKE